MNTIDNLSFDDVMEKADKAKWKRIVRTLEIKDDGYSKDIQYYSEVGNFDVVLGHSYNRGIFGFNHAHTLKIFQGRGGFRDGYTYPLITFTGSRHFWSSEGRRIERRLKNLEKYLDQYYGEWDRQQELEELGKKEEEQRKIHNTLIKTFR